MYFIFALNHLPPHFQPSSLRSGWGWWWGGGRGWLTFWKRNFVLLLCPEWKWMNYLFVRCSNCSREQFLSAKTTRKLLFGLPLVISSFLFQLPKSQEGSPVTWEFFLLRHWVGWWIGQTNSGPETYRTSKRDEQSKFRLQIRDLRLKIHFSPENIGVTPFKRLLDARESANVLKKPWKTDCLFGVFCTQLWKSWNG